MITLTHLSDIQNSVLAEKAAGKRIGFVPTMGGLHDGHLSLVRQAKQDCDFVVASIFVNPAQFAPHEDFSDYPRPFADDKAKLEDAGCSLLFFPKQEDIYPGGSDKDTQIYVPKMGEHLCGLSRPHFFQGVCTVVLRLFLLVQPNQAYFGEKDFQQLQIIKKMTRDLFLPITVIGCPIVRETNGLAMSSRNQYLSDTQKEDATHLYQGLCQLKTMVAQGQRDSVVLRDTLHQYLSSKSLIELDYAEVVDSTTLAKKAIAEPGDRLVAAGILGKTRLLDNLAL